VLGQVAVQELDVVRQFFGEYAQLLEMQVNRGGHVLAVSGVPRCRAGGLAVGVGDRFSS
jgi:hypothetical protein